MVRLERELIQTESEAIVGGCEGARDCRSRSSLPEVRKPRAEPDRDVERVAGGVSRTSSMGDARARAGRFPSGAAPSSAPTAEGEVALKRSLTALCVTRVHSLLGLSN